MWYTLATLELALGCLFPIIVAVQQNFPADAEVRKAAFSALQSYCAGLGQPIHQTTKSNSVLLLLSDKVVHLVLHEDCLIIYLKEYASGIVEPFWTARIDTNYVVSCLNSFLP